MTDLDRFNYIKRQIEARKQEIAQNQGVKRWVSIPRRSWMKLSLKLKQSTRQRMKIIMPN